MTTEKSNIEETSEENILQEEVEKEFLQEEQNNTEVEEIEKTKEEILTEELEKLKEEIKNSEDKYLRLYAEFENFKKRKNQEIALNNTYKSQKIITDILPSLDNLERALQVSSDNEETKTLLKGVEMVYESLHNALKEEGVEVVETKGIFDPNIHHAVMQDNVEDKESGEILEVFQKGYKLKDRVIRPAMVKVNS